MTIKDIEDFQTRRPLVRSVSIICFFCTHIPYIEDGH